METDRLPVDAIAATLLGGLVGAMFALLDGSGTDPVAGATVGGVLFGVLGLTRWMRSLGPGARHR
ncbi:MAG: hypothetical protein ACLFWM_04995 [Actinomycetota bacterium]